MTLGRLRTLYEAMRVAGMAHARWEILVSDKILSSNRRRWLLFLMLLPIVPIGVALAGDLPRILGGKEAYAPAFYTPLIFVVSIGIGMCAGLITGCIGAGGGFIITPALMSVGVKGILAVGTDLFHIFAKAIMGTAVHRKLGNVSVKLALAFLVGSVLGATGGGLLNRTLYEQNPALSDTFINIVYVVLLGFLGVYAAIDFLRLRKGTGAVGAHPGESVHGEMAASGKKGLTARLQSARIPPMITFDEDLVPGGKKIAGVFVAFCGALVGLAAAIMGVGGGFLTFPMFVYVLGVSSFTTVGTDILQIIFTAGLASVAQYAIYGYVFYTLAMGMLIGSLIGIQVGALTTKVVKGIHIRGFYAVSILAGFINRASTLPKKMVELEYIDMSKGMINGIEFVGNIVFWIVVAIFGLWIFSKFFVNIKTLREEV